ncbi:hypothetical protein LTR53_018230, partial [Teratosphaeriaceae sp. CCFEE 6253]
MAVGPPSTRSPSTASTLLPPYTLATAPKALHDYSHIPLFSPPAPLGPSPYTATSAAEDEDDDHALYRASQTTLHISSHAAGLTLPTSSRSGSSRLLYQITDPASHNPKHPLLLVHGPGKLSTSSASAKDPRTFTLGATGQR